MQTQHAKQSNIWGNLLGIVAIVLLMAIPLVIIDDSEFGGADGAGSDVVSQIAPNYNSEWITNWWSPPGGETESALFALQATVGGILIGYFFGYMYGRRKERMRAEITPMQPYSQQSQPYPQQYQQPYPQQYQQPYSQQSQPYPQQYQQPYPQQYQQPYSQQQYTPYQQPYPQQPTQPYQPSTQESHTQGEGQNQISEPSQSPQPPSDTENT